MVTKLINIEGSHFECIDSANSSYTTFDKYYYIPIETNGKMELYCINIKEIDDKIFLYINNIILGTSTLIHVFESSSTIQLLEKYIQISHDYQLLSIPDGEMLYIFNVTDLIRTNSLKTNYSSVSIKFTNNKIPRMKTLDESLLNNTFFDGDPYKCILYNDRYIIVSKSENNYKAVIVYDFIHKCTHIVNINKKIDSSSLALSEHGKYLLFCDKTEKNNVWLVDLNHLEKINDIKHKQISIITQYKIYSHTFTISNDGKLIAVLTHNNKLVFIENDDNITIDEHQLDIDIGDSKYNTIHIFDYGELIHNKLYTVTIWNKQLQKIFTWIIIRVGTGNSTLFGPKIFVLNINSKEICTDELISLSTNGHQFVYKFTEDIYVYNMNKMILSMINDAILDTLKINLLKVNLCGNNSELMILTKTSQKSYTTKRWISDLLLNNSRTHLDLRGVEFCDTPLLKRNGLYINSIHFFLILLHNHNEIYGYIDDISENKMQQFFDVMLQLYNIISSYNDEINAVFIRHYMEYLIVKITLVFYKSKYQTEKKCIINIKEIIKTFKKLTVAKIFLIKLVHINFGYDITTYI
jgi:hypothetical protein